MIVPGSGLGLLRKPEAQELKGRQGPEVVHRELQAWYAEPKALLITKASLRSRIHRRVFMDLVCVKRFDAGGRVIGEFRIIGLFTSTAYTRSTRTIPYLRRKVDDVIARAGFGADRPFRQGAGQRAGDLSARRTVPDRRGPALSIRDCDPAARGASARARAGAPRPLRSLHVGAGLCAARPRFERCARADRRVSVRHLQGSRVRAQPVLPGRPAGARAFHHRAFGRARRRSRPRRARRRRRRDRAHLDRRAARAAFARTRKPARPAQLFERYRHAFSASYRDRYSPADRARRYPHHRRAVGGTPAQRRFPCPFAGAGRIASA